MGTVVVGVDGSEGSHAALRWAADEARLRGATLSAVYVYEFDAGELAVEAVALEDRRPASTLVEAPRRAELLVVGSRGRGGFVGLILGSVSQQCVQHAHCPVVVLPHDHDEVPA